jgi:isoleucyl-tRNA synthetase
MKKAGLSVKIDTIVHSYPHCWRTDVPLIYRAISAWYVNVEKIKDKMLAANDKINWTPDNLKHGRFGKWLEGARDWNISRNRYWGSAIPVWQSEDKKHEWCVGSIEELFELNKDFGQIEKKDGKFFYTNTGKEIDIHKHFVDDVKIKHPET